MAQQIKLATGDNKAANAAAHAVWGALSAYASGNNALSGAAGAASAELMAPLIIQAFNWNKDNLTEEQKQTVSALSTVAAGLAGGITGDSTNNALAGATAGRNATENNYLSNAQYAEKVKELEACDSLACRLQVDAKWTGLSVAQEASYASGVLVGIPAGLVDSVQSLVDMASNPSDTLQAMKALFASDDVLGTMTDAVKQSYIERIDKMEMAYQKAGAGGSYSAGVEAGKLITDMAGLLSGGAGVAKGGAVLTEKVAAKVAGKAATETTSLLKEMSAQGIKHTPENIVQVIKNPEGKIVFLEKGDSKAGLQHIVAEHSKDFANIGVSETQISKVIMQTVKEGNIVGYQGKGITRPIYETVINGEKQRIAITVSNNGFVVGANPAGRIK